jgi:hypothetical protein
MELATLKESAELLHVEAIGGHVGILGIPFPGDLVHHQVRVFKTEDSPDDNLLASLSPCTRASYFAMLFDARKCICSMYCSLSPLGEVRTTPAHKPPSFLEPSKFMRQ